MPSRAVCYYDLQVCLFLHVLHDGKCTDCAVQMMPGHACSCFHGDREHRLPSSSDHALATDRKLESHSQPFGATCPKCCFWLPVRQLPRLLASGWPLSVEPKMPASHQSPAPGFGKKNWNLSGFPSHSLESGGGGFFIVMFGQTFANSVFSRNHFSSPGSVSGLIASTGHSGTQTPQSMHSSGWMTSMFSPS